MLQAPTNFGFRNVRRLRSEPSVLRHRHLRAHRKALEKTTAIPRRVSSTVLRRRSGAQHRVGGVFQSHDRAQDGVLAAAK
jgi:hypothetical protein